MPGRVTTTAAAVMLATFAGTGGLHAGDAPCVAAAQARQDAFKTVVIEFKRTEVIAKGAISERNKTTRVSPPEEVTLRSNSRLIIDGEKYRYEDGHPAGGPRNRWLDYRPVMTFDGSLAKALFPGGHDGQSEPEGFLDHPIWRDRIKGLKLLPITMTFRGLKPALTPYPVDRLLRVDRTLTIDGATCQEYVAGLADHAEVHFWLDPKQDHAVRRVRSEGKDKTADQLDIRYRQEGAVGWVPTSWVYRRVSAKGDVSTTDTTEVTALRVNEPQPADLFNIEFPAGAQVYVLEGNKYYRVQPDGSLIEFFPTPKPEPPAEPWRGDPLLRWLVVGVGAVVLALLCVYGLRRKPPREG